MNAKLLFLLIILICVGVLFGNKVIAILDCNDTCSFCADEPSCNASPVHCQWDPIHNQCCGALETTWPPSPLGTQLTACAILTDMVRYFYEWGLFIGGLAVFISLLIGGFLYLTSIGNPSRMTEAKDRIFSALIGLILLFSIYLILNTINPELTVLNLPEFMPGCDTYKNCPTCATLLPAACPYECKGDGDGDGTKEGFCSLKMGGAQLPCDCAPDQKCSDCKISCNKNQDCGMGESCAEGSCIGSFRCKGDSNPGDGTKEGSCTLVCEGAIWYDDIKYGGNSTQSGLTECNDFETDTTIKSIDVKGEGKCQILLYQGATGLNCPQDKIYRVIANDVPNIKDLGIDDPTKFDSITVKETPF